MVVNEYAKQFFLYAKGWYQSSGDIWEDLKKIRGVSYLTVEGEEEQDLILNKVTQCAIECILEKPRHRALTDFQELLEKLSPTYWVRGVLPTCTKYNYETELLNICLSIMRFAQIENIDPEKECKFDILPKKEV